MTFDDEILKQKQQGVKNKTIAAELGISEAQVKHGYRRAKGLSGVKTGYTERKPKVFKEEGTYTVMSRLHSARITEDSLRQLKKFYCLEGLTINQICREMGMPRRDFYLIKTAFGITKDDAPYIDEDLINNTTEDLATDSLQELKRLYFTRLQQQEVAEMRRELAKLRKPEYLLNKAHELTTKHMPEFAKTYKGPAIIATDNHKKEFVIEPNIVDLHLGKLGWEPECGENYDYKIARDRFNCIVEDVYIRAKELPVKKIIYPFGSDFWQINSKKGGTFAGTLVDSDSRSPKLFIIGVQMHITAIDLLRQLGPVVVVVVPGNHDEEISYYALLHLAAWYKNDPDVEVWTDIKSRKYVEFGVNLIGYAHGHQEGKRILGNMQVEAPEAWGRTKVREWHLAHKHRYQVTEEHGVLVRELSALTGKDAWEFGMGFQGAITRTQTFVWHKEDGLYATWEKAIWSEHRNNSVLTI